MPFTIDIQNQGDYPVDAACLQDASAAVLVQHDVSPDTTLSVVIVDDTYIQNLNRQYRQVDAPTDVLSFPADPPPVEIEDEPLYLGDMVIAYPYAAAQAKRESHELNHSLALLVVHGTLHLLGYDHDTAERRAEMWAAQDAALNALNIPTSMVPRLEEANHDDPA
jgi:probable rRNA maturation factor